MRKNVLLFLHNMSKFIGIFNVKQSLCRLYISPFRKSLIVFEYNMKQLEKRMPYCDKLEEIPASPKYAPLEIPQTYSEALHTYESLKDTIHPQIYQYYHTLFKHELIQFEENFTKWEVSRIY